MGTVAVAIPAANAGDAMCVNEDLQVGLVLNTLCECISKLGIQATIAEQDHSRATYAEAVRSPTPASKVKNTLQGQPERSTAASGSCRSTSAGKISRKERSDRKTEEKNDVKRGSPAAHDVIKPDVKAKSLSQSSNGTRKEQAQSVRPRT